MDTVIDYQRNITYLAITLLMMFAFAVATVFIFFVKLSEAREIVNCASFGSYAEAVQAYNAGEKKLDHNHNGIPCESLVH